MWNTVSQKQKEQKFTVVFTELTGRLWEGVWTGAVGSEDRMETVALGPCPEVTVRTQKTLIFMSQFILHVNSYKFFLSSVKTMYMIPKPSK